VLVPVARILVDDNTIKRKKMRMAVAGLGHAARTTSDGVEARAALRNLEYHAVLLDIMMPEMEGFEGLA